MPSVKILAISLMLGVFFLTGCCSSTTMLEENWGRSFETAFFKQTIDPQAGQTPEPVEGIDAQSTLRTLQGYRGQFKGGSASAD